MHDVGIKKREQCMFILESFRKMRQHTLIHSYISSSLIDFYLLLTYSIAQYLLHCEVEVLSRFRVTQKHNVFQFTRLTLTVNTSYSAYFFSVQLIPVCFAHYIRLTLASLTIASAKPTNF